VCHEGPARRQPSADSAGLSTANIEVCCGPTDGERDVFIARERPSSGLSKGFKYLYPLLQSARGRTLSTLPMAPNESNTTNGNEADSTTEKLTIHVKEAAMPDDPEAQGKILDDIGELVSDALLENHGVESEKVYGGVGHEYTQVNDQCPECGDHPF
jgi:hypothetical protein